MRVWQPWEVPIPSLDEAYRLLREAGQKELQERCAAGGHGERYEITCPAMRRPLYMCGMCGARFPEDQEDGNAED